MEIAFDSKSLRTLCECGDDANREFGSSVAEILRHRLADLRAATSVEDILIGNIRHSKTTDQNMILDLRDGYKVVFSANHPKNPLDKVHNIDWSRVNRIKILSIGSDYVE